jgi:hypothetical protein
MDDLIRALFSLVDSFTGRSVRVSQFYVVGLSVVELVDFW